MDLYEMSLHIVGEIDKLVDCCEKHKKDEALKRMADLTGKLAPFFEKLFALDESKDDEVLRDLKENAIPAMGEALKAMEDGDLARLSDVMVHGLKERIEAAFSDRKPEGLRDRFKDTSARIVIMFGSGDGQLLKELLGILDDRSKVLVCEPVPEVFENNHKKLRDERLILINTAENPSQFYEALIKTVDFYSLPRMDVCAHPGYDRAFPAEYASFLKQINDNRERLLVNKNTMTRFRDEGTVHILENIEAISGAYFVSDLKKTDISGSTAVIVSAGPSLDKNIEELRYAKGRALIIAVDTALKYMLARDIIPDLFITIDPDKPMENFADERVRDIPVIFDEQTPSGLLREHKAAKFLYNCRDYPKKLFEACGISVEDNIASGGSVATAAFAICSDLGINNIILIGQDLAYTGESTHAGGTVSAGVNGDVGTTMGEGIDGKPVRTRSDWLGYLRWFETTIEHISKEKREIRVIDATEGGALIRGTEVMTFRDAIEKTCGKTEDGRPGDSLFDKILAGISPALSTKERAKFTELHAQEVATLPELKTDAGEGLKLSEEIGKNIKQILAKQYKSGTTGTGVISKEVKDLVTKMGQIRKRCESRLIFPVINNYAVTFEADEISRILEQKASANSETAKFFFDIEASRVAFRGVVSACEFLIRNCHL